jgi:hypothetical protein
MMEDASIAGPVEVHPANSHRNDFGPRRLDGTDHLIVVAVLAGAHHQAGSKSPAAEGE